jgi:predicted Fe-Mo cluster-binding NifX family protein
MLACIPTIGNSGLEDILSDHFDSAPYFTLYDSTTDELTIVEGGNIHRSHGACHPMSQLRQYRIDGILCYGMGHRAIDILSSEGIKINRAEIDKV